MIPLLRTGHLVGLIFWGLGLLALAAALRPRRAPSAPPPGPRARRLSGWLCAPGAFLTLLTGIGLLHQQPLLLKQPWLLGKLGLIAGLMALDHGLSRAALGPPPPSRALLPLTGLTLLGAVLLTQLRPWAR